MMTGLKWGSILGLSAFFLYAGLPKLADPAAFSLAIEGYRLFGPMLSWMLALWLPWIECLAAGMLWLPAFRVAAAVTLGGMLAVFQVTLISAAVRGLDISCGCTGSEDDSSIAMALVRNCLLLGLVLALLWTEMRRAK